MGTWTNADGLHVKLGTSEGVSTHPAGEYLTYNSGLQITEVVIDLTELTATETILNDVTFIPADSHIAWVEVFTIVAAATGTAIDVGLIDQDRSTEVDYNGFLAAFVTASMNAVGENYRLYETHSVPTGISTQGALVGQEVTNTGYISASRTDATAFTAGKIRLRIAYIPSGIDTPV